MQLHDQPANKFHRILTLGNLVLVQIIIGVVVACPA